MAKITDIKKKKAKGFAYLSGREKTAYERVPETGGRLMQGLMPLAEGREAGPVVWTYRPAGPGHLFLRAGQMVKPGTRGKAAFSVRAEPDWICLSALYRGPMPRILDAWMELMDAAEAKGLRQTGERREIYLKWVGPDSRANVTELQLRLNP